MGDCNNTPGARRRRAHARSIVWSLLIIIAGAMLLPLTGYVYVAVAQENPPSIDELGGARLNIEWGDNNVRSFTWGEARRANSGYTAVKGPETGVLINTAGQQWRSIRNGPVASIMPYFLLAALVGIVAVYAWQGQHKLKEERSGRVVLRWRLWERVLHWVTATLFIILAITGLSMLFGRAVLIPLLGAQGFAAWASLSITLHNYIGPFFTASVALLILAWVWYNIPNKTDWQWFKKGGGFKKGEHPSAGRMNGGEKAWFWIIALVGGVVCLTGVILDFPIWGQTREVMQVSTIIHAVAGIIWVSVFLGHAYIGTLGTEGALEGMTTGYVSSEWAKQHHDQWYDDVKDRHEHPEREVRKPADGGRSTEAKA